MRSRVAQDVEREGLVGRIAGTVPRLPQAQFDLELQLRALAAVAGRLGLYDAQDWLTRKLGCT